jgi:CheY-like chemotaxis protein/two-component sensor histidine kinase
VRDITARKEIEEALREADRRKDEFLAILAHELRNPLAPLRNSLYVLRQSAGERATVDKVRDMMERQVDHLVHLVDDLLEVSRINRGKIALRKQRVGLAAIIQTALETALPAIESAGHRLSITLPSEPLDLEADPIRLAQVFANLLNNAAKYTEAGGRIDVLARQEEQEVMVAVRDTGVGIPADMLPRVFELFLQVETTRGHAQGGLGIGLTLVKSLVELHGGRVEARSPGLGQGSELTVRLPIATGARAEAIRRDAEAPLAPRRILVVDDNRDAADSLGMLLEALGSEVEIAYDGPAALEAVPRYRPEVVLLDIGMPGMNGHEVARRLRERPEGRDLMLVALTGWGQDQDRRCSEAAGFDRHLVKPVALDALRDLLACRPPRHPGPMAPYRGYEP